STLEQRLLLGGAPDAHVDDDLVKARYLHHIREPELGSERSPDLVVVALAKARALDDSGAHRSPPHLRQTRILRPWSSIRTPMRVGPHCEQTTATVETWTGMSLSMMPPCIVPRFALVERLATLTPSTMTRSRVGMTRMTSPTLPRSLPDRTCTRSPLRMRI